MERRLCVTTSASLTERLSSISPKRSCKKMIGPGTVIFGAGRDGGREATFTGEAPYPSSADRWNGEWIFKLRTTISQVSALNRPAPR